MDGQTTTFSQNCPKWYKTIMKNAYDTHLDDDYLLVFLRGCKFSLERTKEKLDMYFSCKTACPEWYDNWDVKSDLVQYLLDTG